MELKFDSNSTFNDYQRLARVTAIYPNIGSNYPYLVYGLNSESGEVADKFKKIIRDKNGIMSEEDKLEIAKELADVTWYVSNLASELGLNFQDMVHQNLIKLYDRMERGVLKGSGDNR